MTMARALHPPGFSAERISSNGLRSARDLRTAG